MHESKERTCLSSTPPESKIKSDPHYILVDYLTKPLIFELKVLKTTDEFRSIWKETVVVLLFRHVPEETGKMSIWLRFETNTSQTRVHRVTATASRSVSLVTLTLESLKTLWWINNKNHHQHLHNVGKSFNIIRMKNKLNILCYLYGLERMKESIKWL